MVCILRQLSQSGVSTSKRAPAEAGALVNGLPADVDIGVPLSASKAGWASEGESWVRVKEFNLSYDNTETILLL